MPRKRLQAGKRQAAIKPRQQQQGSVHNKGMRIYMGAAPPLGTDSLAANESASCPPTRAAKAAQAWQARAIIKTTADYSHRRPAIRSSLEVGVDHCSQGPHNGLRGLGEPGQQDAANKGHVVQTPAATMICDTLSQLEKSPKIVVF
jgi:hypothetical protein